MFPNIFWFTAPLLSNVHLAGPLDFQIGMKIKELYLLAAPLAPANGTLMCRGTPVGKHWSVYVEIDGLTSHGFISFFILP